MDKEKELHQLYNKEYLIFKEQENQLLIDKIYIYLYANYNSFFTCIFNNYLFLL